MTVDERREYDEMFNTLSSDGWACIKKKLIEAYELQDDLLGITTEVALHYARGRLVALKQMIEFELLLKQEYEHALEDELDYISELEA